MEEFSPCPCIPKASLAFLLVEKKESTKILSFERDNSCLCIPIGCNSVRIFVPAYRNTETTPLSLSKENTSLFSLPLKYYYYNQQTLPRTVKIIWCGGGGCSKGILQFHFGPNLGLRLEAGTKLNN